MIRQIVTFRFRPDVDEAARRALLDELSTFPDLFPVMRGWAMGPNTSTRDTTYAWAFVVDFEDRAALDAYLGSEAHETFVAERWRPVIEDRAIVTLDLPGATPVPTPTLS